MGCVNRSDEIKARFDSIDNSLESANRRIDSLNNQVINNLHAKIGDSLMAVFANGETFINQLQSALNKADPGGERLGVSDSLIVNSSDGITLYYYMMKIYGADNDYLGFNKYASLMGNDPKSWLKKLFTRNATVQSYTILTKFKNDIEEIKRDLVKYPAKPNRLTGLN